MFFFFLHKVRRRGCHFQRKLDRRDIYLFIYFFTRARRFPTDGVRVRSPVWRTAGGQRLADCHTPSTDTPGQIFYLRAGRMRNFSAVRRVSNEVDRPRVASEPRLNCVHLLRDPISLLE